MEINLSKYVSKNTLKTVGTLKEFVSLLEKKGYMLIKKNSNFVNKGIKGFPQITFENNEGRNVILRVSQNLDTRLTNNEQIEIINLPIYDLGVDGIPELVIGLTGLEDLESVPFELSEDQITKLFSLNPKPI